MISSSESWYQVGGVGGSPDVIFQFFSLVHVFLRGGVDEGFTGEGCTEQSGEPSVDVFGDGDHGSI